MKTVIVYTHPYNKSYCHALLEATQERAKKPVMRLMFLIYTRITSAK